MDSLDRMGWKGDKGETREQVRLALERGLSPREIALDLGITTQAVYKHIAALRSR